MARLVRERVDLIPELGEIFREYGYEGTSLARVTERTGLGKGSLYNFFPGGKAEMAAAVLEHIQNWFEQEIFRPLEQDADLDAMLNSVTAYFEQGNRICLVGGFALTETRDHFAQQVMTYFKRWEESLVTYFKRKGLDDAQAVSHAANILVTIQGALVVSRARNDSQYFVQALQRLQEDYL